MELVQAYHGMHTIGDILENELMKTFSQSHQDYSLPKDWFGHYIQLEIYNHSVSENRSSTSGPFCLVYVNSSDQLHYGSLEYMLNITQDSGTSLQLILGKYCGEISS